MVSRETPEEKSAFAESLKKIMMAREAIMKDADGQRSTGGTINPCPVCEKGKLFYSIAYNGHVHARCSTQEPPCVSWME